MLRAFAIAAAGFATACTPPPPRSCTTLPALRNDTSAHVITLRLHVENRMQDHFEPFALCIVVDGHLVHQDAPELFIAEFAKHRSLDVTMRLAAGVEHEVHLYADFKGRGGSLDGYKFAVSSAHKFTGDGDLFGRFVELGGPETPLAQRPSVKWTDSPPSGAVD